ncbi:MAG: hypothetical protein KDK99_22020, partial [Verrucomicrobiales bacterium]|nr:hypothetical protein [Verrucomicrobiales bacterium]
MKTFLLMSGFASVAAAQPALTIYNEDFAVVRDRVNLDLAEGSHELTYSGATALLEPESVILRDPTGQMVFRILEQSYRNDPADQALLLKLFEGKEIDFEVPVGEGKTVVQRGKIVRAGDPQPIIEMDGKLRFDLPGQPLFDSLGDNTILQPTLSWQLQAPAAVKGEAELAYLTGGLSWSADYNLVLPEQGETFDWVGWVSVNNHCGKTFEEANIKLLAGDVARVAPPQRMPRAGREMYAMAAPMVEAEVTEKAFDDFHLYTLPRAVTLMDRETKQVEFTRA